MPPLLTVEADGMLEAALIRGMVSFSSVLC